LGEALKNDIKPQKGRKLICQVCGWHPCRIWVFQRTFPELLGMSKE
jgi:hypothetical protein